MALLPLSFFFRTPMPTLIYYDQARHQSMQRATTEVAARLTALLTEYQTLGLPAVVAAPVTADLPALVQNPEGWLMDKYLSGFTPTLNGLKLNQQKALELLERPAGFDDFVKLAKEVFRELEEIRRFGNATSPAGLAEHYQVASGWQVSIKPTAAAEMEEYCKSYANTPAQEALLTKVKALAAAVDAFRSSGIQLSLENLLKDSLQETGVIGIGPVRVKPEFIHYYAK